MADVHVVVVGGSGFLGGTVCEALERRGVRVVVVHAPRLTVPRGADPDAVVRAAADRLRPRLAGAAAVVNAAGISEASSRDEAALDAANALVPMVIAMACAAENTRFVQVSSAAVQGRRTRLDDCDQTSPLTPYASSKAKGERLARQHHPSAVVYRPPGVHGPARSITRSLARLATGPLSSVAAPGDGSAPQALVEDVADAVVFLALHPSTPPAVVHHPASGLTTASLLRLLGDGHEPRLVPRRLAHAILRLAQTAGRVSPGAAAQARRLEVLWCGQEQSASWLSEQGWHASTNEEDWRRLGRLARHPNPPSPGLPLAQRESS